MVSYKTEIKPDHAQIVKIEKDFEACRKVYNLYLLIALKQIESTGNYGGYNEFLTWFYKYYIKKRKYNSQYPEILNKDAIRNICRNVDITLSKYIRGMITKPHTKDLNKSHISLYFLSQKKGEYTVICERHRIYIPAFGWLRIKEKGYIPTNQNEGKIVSGYISYKAGRYYVSVNVEHSSLQQIRCIQNKRSAGEAIGIDLGLKHFAVISDGRVYENVNHGITIKRLNKHIRKQQKALQRKRLSHISSDDGQLKGTNYDNNTKSLSRKYKRSDDIRSDFVNNVIADLISGNPEYIAIEDLHVRDMVKERTFSKAVTEQTFREFRIKLQKKCISENIELRIVNRWFPSSKICHNCRRVNHGLRLSDRVFKCKCGYVADRDYNASLNIRDTEDYYVYKLDNN